ncbi:MAG: hypothetical protein MHM6MM_004611 [Cercozoa sp. M6MM]
MAEDRRLVYFERQEGMLCGVHCLNNLLQTPMFSEIDLGEIALQIDRHERALLGDTRSDNNGTTANVDPTGNFSVQVLNQALQVVNCHTARCNSNEAAGVLDAPENETAFLLNYHAHWFCIRRVHNVWFDLNSMHEAPRPIGTFFLGAYLHELQSSGYDVFVVRGELPPEQTLPEGSTSFPVPDHPRASILTVSRAEQLEKARRLSEQQRQAKRAPEDDLNDPHLQAALRASQEDVSASRRQAEDEQMQRAIQLSLGHQSHPSASSASHAPDEDADLALAIRLSMQDQ